MVQDERYERLWLEFLYELNKKPSLTLASFLRGKDVNPATMKHWVEERKLGVKKARRVIQFCRETLFQGVSPTDSALIYLPMTVVESREAPDPSSLMKGITPTFPDGAVASVNRATPEALHAFITLYKEGVGL